MGKKLILFLLVALAACTNGQKSEQKLSAAEFMDMKQKVADLQIIDLRTSSELKSGFIPGSTQIDWNADQATQQLLTLDRGKTYLLYCLSGGRSADAAEFMRSNGFKNVYELSGGILKWRAAGYELELPEGASVAQGMTVAGFENLYKKDSVVLIDFYAEWCGPCKKMEPFLAKMKQEYKGRATIIRIDADKNIQLCKDLGIDALPVVYIYKNGKLSFQHLGFISEQDLRKQLM
jgi:thioredoxin 1